jgi:DNA-binding winged helix-turn-helix (wHTH) protein/tetratricopeptide (TPR) repeat protein
VILRFAEFELDESLYTLRRDGEAVEVQPKALDLLLYLIQNRHRVVSKDELLDRVWSGVTVNEESLSRAVHAARTALGDDGERQRIIQTVRRRGFRFVAELEASVDSAESPTFGTSGAPAQSDGVPFIGRESIMAQLEAALDEAWSGRGRLVLIGGESGIGKTRLAAEFSCAAAGRGARVMAGWCYEGEGAPPFWPWVQILRTAVQERSAAALRDHCGAGAVDIAQIVPALRERLPDLPEPPLMQAEQARFRLFDSITSYLKNAAASEPHLLVLDDLHWADRASLLLIEFLANELRSSRLVVLGNYRVDEIHAEHPLVGTLGKVVRHADCERVFLQGLTRDEVERFIAVSGGVEPTRPLVEAVLEKTEGNPFLIIEIVRLLKEEGRLDAPAAASAWEISLPRGVREVINRRLRRLSPEARQVLAVGAVIGREFDREVLERVWDGSGGPASAQLEEAVRAGIIAEIPRTAGRHRFAHGLIRETLYEEMSGERRVLLHRCVGEALEAVHAPNPAPHMSELAVHFFKAAQGGDIEKAIDYAIRAGERANVQMAYEEATGFFERALEALDLRVTATERQRCELLLAVGDSQRKAGNFPAVRKTVQQAAEIARRLAAPDLLSRAALGVGFPFSPFEIGVVDEVEVRLIEEALVLVGDEPSAVRSRLLARLSAALYWSDDFGRTISLSEEAAAVARRIGDPATLAHALSAQYLCMLRPGVFENRLDIATEMVQLAEESGERELAVQSHVWCLIELLDTGEIDRVDAEIERLQQLADETRQPVASWYVTVSRATKALLEGRFDDAERLAQIGLSFGERLQDPNVHQAYAMQMFLLCWERGQFRVIEAEARKFMDQYPQVGLWRCVLTSLRAELGDEEGARRELARIAANDFEALGHDEGWMLSVALLAELCLRFSDVERAKGLYERLLPLDGHNVRPGMVGWHGPVARFLGLLAEAASRFDVAAGHYESALETSVRMGARPSEARTRFDYARLLVKKDGPDARVRATGLADEALAAAQEIGMESLVSEISAWRKSLGAPTR